MRAGSHVSCRAARKSELQLPFKPMMDGEHRPATPEFSFFILCALILDRVYQTCYNGMHHLIGSGNCDVRWVVFHVIFCCVVHGAC